MPPKPGQTIWAIDLHEGGVEFAWGVDAAEALALTPGKRALDMGWDFEVAYPHRWAVIEGDTVREMTPEEKDDLDAPRDLEAARALALDSARQRRDAEDLIDIETDPDEIVELTRVKAEADAQMHRSLVEMARLRDLIKKQKNRGSP